MPSTNLASAFQQVATAIDETAIAFAKWQVACYQADCRLIDPARAIRLRFSPRRADPCATAAEWTRFRVWAVRQAERWADPRQHLLDLLPERLHARV